MQAQWLPEGLLTSPALAAADSNRFRLTADVCGFFKNNEYFSPVAVGQTYPGATLQLAARYQVSTKFRAEAGAYALRFFGDGDGLAALQPFIRLQYAITPTFSMVLGNLYGGVNHRLMEPLYRWERHCVERPEAGLQFVLQADRLFGDVWVDWQRYIRRGDDFSEQLTFGTSLEWQLTAPDNRFGLSLPVQLLINHHGGQIDVSEEKMIVLGNLAGALRSCWRFDSRLVQSAGIDLWLAGYYDRYPDPVLRPFRSGWGVYPTASVNAAPFTLMLGYWQGERFYAFQGEALFGSFDPFQPEHQLKRRRLLTAKLAFEKEVVKRVHVGAQIETY
jgi:hypothetical protein